LDSLRLKVALIATSYLSHQPKPFLSFQTKWFSTFYSLADSRPDEFNTGERKMETLTNEEMLEIEGGDWYGFDAGFLYAAVYAIVSL
jgi:hypothetical protein